MSENIRQFSICSLMAAVLVLLSSCAEYQNFPPQWDDPPPPSATSGCPDISGRYSNSGESTWNRKRPFLEARLTGLFFYPEGLQGMLREAENVTITQKDDETVEVLVVKEGSIIRRKTLLRSKGEFFCEDGQVKIKAKDYTTVGVAEIPSQAVEFITMGLVKHNGYLICNRTDSTAALVSIVPTFWRYNSWERFKEIQ